MAYAQEDRLRKQANVAEQEPRALRPEKTKDTPKKIVRAERQAKKPSTNIKHPHTQKISIENNPPRAKTVVFPSNQNISRSAPFEETSHIAVQKTEVKTPPMLNILPLPLPETSEGSLPNEITTVPLAFESATEEPTSIIYDHTDNGPDALRMESPEDLAVMPETEFGLQTQEDFDDQTMTTFEGLLELSQMQGGETDFTPSEAGEIFTGDRDDRIIVIHLEQDPAMPQNAFEELVRIQPPQEIDLSVESIRVSANEQPLDETLVQLALILQEAQPENEEVVTILRDLSEILFETDEETEKTPETIRLTPEVTSKMLALIHLLGYDDPEKALLDFVASRDLQFLAQTMQYLTQLADEDEQEELLADPQDNPLSLMIRSIQAHVGRMALAAVA